MLRSSAVGEARSPAETFRGRTAILFDLDGTLYGGPALAPFFAHVDAVTGLRVRALVGESDPARAFDAIERLRAGDPALRSKSDVLERRFGIGLAEMNRFRERFTDVEAYVAPDPRAARLLRGLAKERALALGTNNAPRLARRLLARLGVDPSTFAAILTSEDVGAAKPDARFFREVARRLGRAPSEIVSVGDRAESDLAPAEALGFGAWEVRGPDDLFALEALLR